jgi:hypothetical protein
MTLMKLIYTDFYKWNAEKKKKGMRGIENGERRIWHE